MKPLREQVLVNNPFEQAKTSEEVHVVGLHSFEDLQQSVESTKWEQIELETYERVNQIQATPNFRHFTPCLTNTTNNALKPQSIVNGMSHASMIVLLRLVIIFCCLPNDYIMLSSSYD